MNVGLIDIDSKIPNLALMKLSAHYKEFGFDTELTKPLFAEQYDLVFASKVFPDTAMPVINGDVTIGGSGTDNNEWLPSEVEHIMPDYSLYKDMDYSIGFTTRGCFRKCPFCIVPQKEGGLRSVADIYEFWDLRHKKIVFFDNNILALPEHFERIANQILLSNTRVDFNQGLDIRILSDSQARLLAKMKPITQWRFSFDSIAYERGFREGAQKLLDAGINPRRIMVYVLCGYDEDIETELERIRIIKHEYGFDPFVMPFNKTDTRGQLAMWVNDKVRFAVFETFDDYLKYLVDRRK